MSIDESKKLTSDLLACIDEGRGGEEWQDRFHRLFKAHASPDQSVPKEIRVQRMHVLSFLLSPRRPAQERILRMRYSSDKIISYRRIADDFEVSVSKIISDEKRAIRSMNSIYARRRMDPIEASYSGGVADIIDSPDPGPVTSTSTESDVLHALSGFYQGFDI